MRSTLPPCCARAAIGHAAAAAEQCDELPPPHAEHGGPLPRVPPPILASRSRRAQAV